MNVAIIPAAGKGLRFGGETPKQFTKIAGAPLIIHTLRAFDLCPEIDTLVIALRPEDVDTFNSQLASSTMRKEVCLVDGGGHRPDSILNALDAIKDWHPELVAVHDAVRPLITPQMISIVLARARESGAAILALPATDTIKEVEHGMIRRTIDRKRIYRAQTPQAFRYDLLLKANTEARNAGLLSPDITDDSLLVERLGIPVAIVEGDPENIKITTPADLILAERILEHRKFDRDKPAMRIGIGNDIHRLVEGRRLVLGGVDIPFDSGLLGHSDGDSLTHAIIDALLGAAGLGDIGTHFSDRETRWEGADSFIFLHHVCSLLRENGYKIANIDATIIAERPRMMPHLQAMKTRLSEVLQIDHSQINLKAKTNEGLESTGRGEAIAAQAVALIYK
ncbi:MAG: 2-C-methyl-D-erythritol 4-phosphate cytidylyltransferase [Acidobacteria bacterium]|nr:2-C-methyl-D-erythritol 4-phosphate cytidylyltransferase [Acidobacteriota bacterium]